MTIGGAIILVLLSSCNKSDRVYSDNPKANSELTKKFNLQPISSGGIGMLLPSDVTLVSDNTTADFELKREQYRTEIVEDKTILDFAWGVNITHIEFNDQKFKDTDSLKSALDKIEKNLKTQDGSTILSTKRGDFSSRDIKGLSLDCRSSNRSNIETDQTMVIFTKENKFWQVSIIGIVVSEDPNRDLFEQLKDHILSSIEIK